MDLILENYLNNYIGDIKRETIKNIIENFNILEYNGWEDKVNNFFSNLEDYDNSNLESLFIQLFRKEVLDILSEYSIEINENLSFNEIPINILNSILSTLVLIENLDPLEYRNILNILTTEELNNEEKIISLIKEFVEVIPFDYLNFIESVDNKLIEKMINTFTSKLEDYEKEELENKKSDMEFLNKILIVCDKYIPFAVEVILRDTTNDTSIETLLELYNKVDKNNKDISKDIFSILKINQLDLSINEMYIEYVNGMFDEIENEKIYKNVIELENKFIEENIK